MAVRFPNNPLSEPKTHWECLKTSYYSLSPKEKIQSLAILAFAISLVALIAMVPFTVLAHLKKSHASIGKLVPITERFNGVISGSYNVIWTRNYYRLDCVKDTLASAIVIGVSTYSIFKVNQKNPLIKRLYERAG